MNHKSQNQQTANPSGSITKAQAIQLINEAYSRLAGACSHTHDWDRYVVIEQEEENEHRRYWKPDHVQCGLTRTQVVRLFTVKHIFQRWVPGERDKVFTPEAKDFLHIKRSVFAACSIAHTCAEEILKEFPMTYMQHWLASIDYAELNKDPHQAAIDKAEGTHDH